MKTKSVKEIKEIIDNLKPDQYLEYIDILKDDERKSVQKLALSLAKKFKYVYLGTKSLDLPFGAKLNKKIENTLNILHLPNCNIVACKNDKAGNLAEVQLDTYSTIKCNALVMSLYFCILFHESTTTLFEYKFIVGSVDNKNGHMSPSHSLVSRFLAVVIIYKSGISTSSIATYSSDSKSPPYNL